MSQLNTEMAAYRVEAEQFQSRLLRRETDCHGEGQAALGLNSQNMSLTTWALHFEIALKHNELQCEISWGNLNPTPKGLELGYPCSLYSFSKPLRTAALLWLREKGASAFEPR